MAELGLGILGTGRIAQSHLRSLAPYTRAKTVAVFDVIPDRAKSTADEFGIPNVCASADELLARSDVDAVIVAVPPFVHAPLTIAALEAGKHVLCEKPFTRDPGDAAEMVATAERVGKYLASCSGRSRVGEAAKLGHEIAVGGGLGKVYHARVTQLRLRGRPGIDLFRDAPWFMDRSKSGGGALIDTGVYRVDWMLWMLGNPAVKSVLASTFMGVGEVPPDSPPQDVEDMAVLMITCKNGSSAMLETAFSANMAGQDAMLVFGSEAGLRFDPLTKISAGPDRKPVEEKLIEGDPQSQIFRGNITTAFCDALLEGHEPPTPARDALVVTQVIDAAYRSAETGEAVYL